MASRFEGEGLRGLGRPTEAAAAFRRSVASYERVGEVGPLNLYHMTCSQAGLASLAGVPGSGVAEADRRAEADRAMVVLRRTIDAGNRNVANLRVNPALDPLRGRDDFRLLMLDLAFPASPFVP